MAGNLRPSLTTHYQRPASRLASPCVQVLLACWSNESVRAEARRDWNFVARALSLYLPAGNIPPLPDEWQGFGRPRHLKTHDMTPTLIEAPLDRAGNDGTRKTSANAPDTPRKVTSAPHVTWVRRSMSSSPDLGADHGMCAIRLLPRR